jgi:heme o synthase
MNRQIVRSVKYKASNDKSTSLLSDLKALFKGKVLIANTFPVFAGFWLALYFTDGSLSANLSLLFLTMLGSILVMGGALVINNWYDVDIDTVMARTKHRPTVTGRIPLPIVLTIGIVTSILGIVMLLFTTYEATLYAFIGWFTYVFLYTMWSKRRYTFNTVIGSISGAVTPLIGWAALDSGAHIVPISLAIIIFIWQMPHTFAIAIRKYDEYKAAGVAMLPVVKGMENTKRQMLVFTACLLPMPFFLSLLGITFIVIATLLNIVYLALAISGFYAKNDMKWARIMFLMSVNYLMMIFLMAIIVTIL